MTRSRLGLLAALALLAAAPPSNQDKKERRLLLVSAVRPAPPGKEEVVLPPDLTPTEVRRMYLGVTVEKGGVVYEPLINRTDELLYEVFLQKVVHLSDRAYERALTLRTFQTGSRRPPVYREAPDLVDTLRKRRYTVTFMWDDTMADVGRLRIRTELWKGTLD